ncbi:CHAT domain-containing protein [Actinophytocola sp. NPDC049390]|uniref:CHAT domain-containing protein n=1 Tax=Actinophytocola sp. NPDC049390 TaxID=3363894 RepID=UPI0037BB12FE
MTALRAAAASSGCSARQQVRAAVAAAEILGELGEWHEATERMGTAVELLATLAGRHLPIGDRRSALREFSTAPVRAASYAVEAGQPARALELLERGRGLLFAENTAFRNGVGELASRAPALASALTRVITELDVATDADSRHQLDRDRQRLLEQIRELDGFETFLKPQRLSEILAACRSGPVVVPLAARERLDALIVTTDGVRPVSLLHEPFETFSTHVRQLVEGVGIATDGHSGSAERGHGEHLVRLGLDWLWEAITGPVLDALGLLDAPDGGKPPRVWWCPTGILPYLPLHAAGRVGGPHALDRAVFSYTTSIRMLSQAPSWQLREDSSPLVVGLSRTPGLPDLPAVEQELAFLAGTFPRRRILRNAAATRAQVVAALPEHDIAHFTCHGGDDPERQYEGQLFVHDGALRLPDIATMRVDQARLAFLSACTTARPALALPDEALSIATGFQLAGFSDVVASLWPIADHKAFQVAADFYTALTTGAESAAHALHHAVHQLRAREPERPSLWAPYIHLGA